VTEEKQANRAGQHPKTEVADSGEKRVRESRRIEKVGHPSEKKVDPVPGDCKITR